jgi:hypothetical protein
MTRFRLAAIAALSALALLVTTTGGEAQKGNAAGTGDFRVRMTCKTAQRTARDFAKITTRVYAVEGAGRRRERLFPVEATKVVTKLRDLTRKDGNDVVDGKDADKTNDNGVAKTKLEFDGFGNYRAISKAKIDGQVVGADAVKFGVEDDESGKCDKPLSGAG